MKLLKFSVFLFAVSAAFGQQGSISGTVQDGTGAILAKAGVKLTSKQQGTVRTQDTNEAGVYSFTILPQGTYDLEVSAQGFKTAQRTDLILSTGQNMRMDVTMEVGNVSDNVTVSANVESVNTETSELSGVVDNKKVVEMPLNGRVWWNLANLVPGVIPPAQGSSNGFRGGFNVAGSAEQNNNFSLNGMDNNDATTSSPAFRPSIDSIQEFNILTGVYPAQYGYGAGGQVLVTTKSGTNAYHGSGFEFIRNQAVLTARNFFQTGPTPSFKRNQFGGVIGGPIRKDKTFFFFSYEGLRLAQAIVVVDSVPGAGMHTGDFSQLLPNIQLKNPSGGVFAGNLIPPSQISPIGQNLMSFYPLPTSSSAPGVSPVNNFGFSRQRPDNYNVFSLKLDHQFSSKDSGFITANYFNEKATERINQAGCSATPLPLFGCDTFIRHELFGIQETHIFSPSMVNEVRVAATFELTPAIVQTTYTPFWSLYGIHPLTVDTFAILPHEGPPNTAATGFTSFSNQVFRRFDPRYQFTDTFNWTLGRHTIKIGGNESHLGINATPPSQVAGSVTFTNTSTGPTSGYAAADMLLGLPASTSLKPNPLKSYPRLSNIFAFIQDDWKVNSRLTVNIGLRWEMNTPPLEYGHGGTNFDPVKGIPVTENTDGYGVHMFNFDWHDYAPRVGFAWQPWGDNKTVVRGGAGTFYQGFPTFNGGTANVYVGFPLTVTNTYTSSLLQPITLSDPFPSANAVTSNTLTGAFKNFVNARIYEWSLGVQHQLTNSMLVEATYMGSAGNHLRVTQNINQPAPGPGTPSQVNARRPYPLYGNISMIDAVGQSRYESLQTKVQQRYNNGLTYTVAYTFSHSDDDVNTTTNQFDRRTGRGPSSFDVRHRLVISPVYELPLGEGKRWANKGPLAWIIGGWQLSPLVQWQTGNPLTPTLSGNYSNTGGTTDRPNVIGDPNANAPNTPQQWFDRSVFVARGASGTATATYVFGNAGVGIITSPGLVNVDISIAKTFRYRERYAAQFRAEIFNLMNHANFGYPNLVADTSAFGTINSALDPRVSQFALKLSF
jgi:hypothetical protein